MVFESFGYTMSSVHDGAAVTMRLVTDPELEGVSGQYYDRLREARAHRQAYDRDARARLRALSERLTGLGPAAT